jgi:hypothetical protein
MSARECYKAMSERNFKSIHGVGRSRRGQITLRREKPVGESEIPVHGELNPPKNLRIPRRIQEIANGGSWSVLMVVLERRGVKSEERGEGVSSIQGC